jgi:integrase
MANLLNPMMVFGNQHARKPESPGRRVHDFRRSTVRRLEQAGVSRSVGMKLTGHKTESIYRRYAIVSKSDLEDATRRLDAFSDKNGSMEPEKQVKGGAQ